MNLNRPLVYITVFFILGICLGLKISFFPLFWLALGAFFFAIAFIQMNGRKVFIGLGIIFLGAFWLTINEPPSEFFQKLIDKELSITGKIQPATPGEGKYLIKLERVNNVVIPNTPLVLVRSINQNDNTLYKWGDTVKFKGKFVEFMEQRNPGSFSEKWYWETKQVGGKFLTRDAGQILSLGKGLISYSYKLRLKIIEKITNQYSFLESSLIKGIILGDKSDLDSDLYTIFQKLGIAHILAVSGLHVGYVILLYSLIMEKISSARGIKLAMAFFILGGYSLITGLTPSVVRASIMAFLTLLSVYLGRYRDFYTLLACAALTILFFNPYSLFSISFQLSFITTWGLVYLFPLGESLFAFLPPVSRKVIIVPIVAQLASMPLTLYYFNMVSLVAPLANIIFVGLISFLVPLIIIVLLLTFIIPFLVQPLLLFSGGLLFILVNMGIFLDEIVPMSALNMPRPHFIIIAIYYLTLLAIREKKKILFYSCFPVLIICLIIPLVISKPLSITFLDVGQGDSAVVITPQRKTIVIDGGPEENIPYNYLKYRGINKVDLLILSHPDLDHITGLFKIIKNIPVKMLMLPPDVENNPELRQLQALAEKKGTKVLLGQRGMVLNFPSQLTIKILFPIGEALGLDVNNASIVAQLSYQGQDVLFTGDIELAGLDYLIQHLESVEIIKVPHHGSKGAFSEGLYNKTDPRVAVISAGKYNRYGHPHEKVIQGLEDRKIKIYRTDLQGGIILKIKKSKLKFYPTLTE